MEKTNTEKLKSVCVIVYVFVHLIITYAVSASVEVGAVLTDVKAVTS